MIAEGTLRVLRSEAADDGWAPVWPLLTCDGDGRPRVCMLSPGQVRATTSGDALLCVVRSRRTTANLQRTGAATMVVVDGCNACYLRLTVSRSTAQTDGGVVVAFDVEGEERDSVGVPLSPLEFWCSAELRGMERWDADRALLDAEETTHDRGARQ